SCAGRPIHCPLTYAEISALWEAYSRSSIRLSVFQVHLRGDIIQYFFYRTPKDIYSFRHDIFGLANYFGLADTLIVLVLLTISNNLSIRTLGATRWKAIQRWNYVGAIFMLTHGVLYQTIEKRMIAFVAGLLIVAAAVTVMQFSGFWRTRQQLNQC